MMAIRDEREFVVQDDFVKAVRKVAESKLYIIGRNNWLLNNLNRQEAGKQAGVQETIGMKSA